MNVQTEGSGKCYTLHVHRRLVVVALFMLHEVEKSYVNARMPEKVNFPSRHWHSGIIVSGTSGYGLVRHFPAMVKYLNRMLDWMLSSKTRQPTTRHFEVTVYELSPLPLAYTVRSRLLLLKSGGFRKIKL